MKGVRSDSAGGTNGTPQKRTTHPQRGPFFSSTVASVHSSSQEEEKIDGPHTERSRVGPAVLVSRR